MTNLVPNTPEEEEEKDDGDIVLVDDADYSIGSISSSVSELTYVAQIAFLKGQLQLKIKENQQLNQKLRDEKKKILSLRDERKRLFSRSTVITCIVVFFALLWDPFNVQNENSTNSCETQHQKDLNIDVLAREHQVGIGIELSGVQVQHPTGLNIQQPIDQDETRVEHEIGIPSEQPEYQEETRTLASWRSTGSPVVIGTRLNDEYATHVLEMLPIMPGTRMNLTFHVKDEEESVCLGFVRARFVAKNKIDYEETLEDHRRAFGYCTWGSAYYHGDLFGGPLPEYKSGVVTFLLDLSGSGKLRILVDDKPPITVFDKMNEFHDEPDGLLPAVSFSSDNSKVEFLGFQ